MVRVIDEPGQFTARKPRQTPEQVRAAAELQAQVLRARQRRDDNRRKIILGAALRQMAAAGDPDARHMIDRILRSLTRPQDRAAFSESDQHEASSSPARS